MFSKRKSLSIGGIIILSVFLVLAAGCGASREVKVDADDNGKSVDLKVGQVLVLSLESNPTTGYAWEPVDFEGGVLQQEGDWEFKPASDAVGASGVQTFRLKATEAGSMELKLLHHRPWEKDEEPLDTFTLQVTVK
jgi:inhibitor of cysteine peptidase